MIIYKRIEILIKYKRIKITIKYKYISIPIYQIFSPVFATKIPKAEPRREKCLSQCVHPCPFRNRGAEHATKPRWSFLRVFLCRCIVGIKLQLPAEEPPYAPP